MVNASSGGGGNMQSARSIVVRRNAAIGDCLAATVVADKLNERGYEVTWQSHPDMHCLLRRHPSITRVQITGGQCHVDLDGCYETDPMRRVRHFSDMFMARANQHLLRLGIQLGQPTNCRPRIRLKAAEREAARVKLAQYPRPWVFCNPRSDSYTARQVPDGIWSEAAPQIKGTKFWIGRHPAPGGFVDLQCRHLDNLITWLSAADLLVSVDTGPLHIGAALGVPLLALGQSSSPELHLSDQADFMTIEPPLRCLNCQANVCPISNYEPPCQKFDPGFIAQWANAKLRQVLTENISAVVAVWKPEVGTLNRCLAALLPQVSEIIVTAEGNSLVPAEALKDPKIRYVRSWRKNIGYSGNANFGARHATGKYLLLCNDDVFVDPGAVAKLMDAMKPGVGMVSGLLYYGDGKTIYHAGKTREPNVRGWGHIDLHKTEHTFRDVTELENVNGAFVLVPRTAFYEVNGLDEELPIFANDDAMCLALRQKGYKILFTPHARGTHLEHQSVNKIGDVMTLVGQANAAFDRKWGHYLTHNATRIPGNFDYLKA